jgi:hypothetical protein
MNSKNFPYYYGWFSGNVMYHTTKYFMNLFLVTNILQIFTAILLGIFSVIFLSKRNKLALAIIYHINSLFAMVIVPFYSILLLWLLYLLSWTIYDYIYTQVLDEFLSQLIRFSLYMCLIVGLMVLSSRTHILRLKHHILVQVKPIFLFINSSRN